MAQKTVLMTILVLLIPAGLGAAEIFKVEPQLTVQEQFTDNVNLSSTNKQHDFITTISPGIRLAAIGQTASIDVDYKLGVNFFAHESQNNYLSHELNANGVYSLSQNTTFRVREYFLRSDDPREQQFSLAAQNGQFLIATDRSRSIYWRNVVEPSLEYRFGRENRFTLFGRDNVYRNDSPFGENSHEDYVSPSLAFWLNQHNGIEAEYGLDNGDFQRSPDLVGHMARGRYIYRTMPGRNFFGDYIFLKRSFDSPGVNYSVHNPSIGTDYAFSQTLSGRLQVGLYKFEPESGSGETSSSGEVSILKRLIDTSVSLAFRWGYFEDYFSPENLGFAKYYGVFGNMTHQWDSRTTLGLNASMQWANYVLSRNDRITTVGATAAYRALKWLTMSIEATHLENSSSVPGLEYNENRVMFRISLVYL